MELRILRMETADHEAAGSDDLCFLTSTPPQAVADQVLESPVRRPDVIDTGTLGQPQHRQGLFT